MPVMVYVAVVDEVSLSGSMQKAVASTTHHPCPRKLLINKSGVAGTPVIIIRVFSCVVIPK